MGGGEEERRRVEFDSSNAGDGIMARPAVAKIVGPRKSPLETLGGSIPQTNKIPGSSLAPRQKDKLPTIPSSNKKKGKLSTKKKPGKEMGLGEKTKDMINDFVNPPKVCAVFVRSSFINYNLRYCAITMFVNTGGDYDTANIPLPEPLPEKRPIDQVHGVIEMCAPTTKHMNWVKIKTFKIMCYVNAFSHKSACTLAYCSACFEKWRGDGEREIRQRGEGERRKRRSNKQEDYLREHVATTRLEI